MKNCFTKLASVLFMVALAGCGANTAGTSSSLVPGAVSANLVYNNASNGAHALAAAVAKVQMTVTGSGANGALPVVRSSANGTPSTIQVDGIYPGTVTLAVKAVDATGAVVYEGFALNAVVDPSKGTTNVGTIQMNQPQDKAQEAGCISCHDTTLSSVTGQNIEGAYKQSAHYTYNVAGPDGWKTGCVGCHGPNHTDVNPSASARCFNCHKTTLGTLGANHDNTASVTTGEAYDARYLTTGNNNCSACHDPHNPLKGIGQKERQEWAESAHGDVKGKAWTHYNFNNTDRGACTPCHTPDGFVRAIGDGWVSTAPLSTVNDTKAKQVLTCDGCHTGFDFQVRTITKSINSTTGGYVAKMGGFGATPKATVTFSNQGESNICIPCHAGRENGDSLIAGNYNFTNKTFVNPHYLGSAGVWQGKAGFKFYTSTARYGVDRPTHGVKTADLVSVNHSFADSNISGAATKGSCVACHLGGKNDHTFETYGAVKFKTYSSTVAYTGCLGCHTGSANGFERYYPTTTNSQFTRVNSGGYVFQRALDMLKFEFQQLGIYFNNNTNPYFFTSSAYTTALADWTTQVAGKDNVGTQTAQQLGLQTMGAAMNLKLLATDKGAAAHNAAFTRAIIADSLVFLQHGNVGDRSSNAPINSISFTAYSTAVTPLAGGSPADGNPSSISNLKNFLVNSGTAAVPGARK